MVQDALRRLHEVLQILGDSRDILDERVDLEAPSWSERRGWTGFLLGVSDDELHRSEAEGFAPRAAGVAGVPASLAALAEAVNELTTLPAWQVAARDDGAEMPRDERGVRARKRPQLAGLLGAVAGMAGRAERIVDVGSGSGHFTRQAAERFELEALGIERNAERVAAAAARAEERAGERTAATGTASAGVARFREVDASKEALGLEPGDLAVGLHACGGLGDKLVLSAAEVGCDVALVSCCLQKIEGPERAPLSRAAAGLVLRRETLGLTNLTSQARGVETTIEATMAARKARYALVHLLRARGEVVAPGEEMRGINRRRARAGLAEIAALALALRGLSPASADEIARHEREAGRRYAAVRRLSLPRNMLARLVEIAVVLDRAAALAESGHHVQVATLFERAVTPRNIAVLASRERSRLGH